MGQARAGVEIGGTFTDLVWMRDDGSLAFAKVPSTPDAPEHAALAAIEQAGIDPARLPELVHGSTVATNAVLTRRGARTAFITTRGFRDILELQRHDRWGNIYEVFYVKPAPLVTRDLAFEVIERLDADGNVLVPLDEESVRLALANALEAGAESIAVSLLHAYQNPVHEQRVAQIAAEIAPELPLTLASDVLPEFREYERSSTVVMSAYVRPVMERYLTGLLAALHERGFNGSLSVMQSSGGVLPAEAAGRLAIRTLLSGPAAGVIGAAAIARAAGLSDIITIDMGGTSTDVALLRGGRPAITSDSKLDELPLRVPMIDMTTVGAGGGSLARIDTGGLLDVGPGSAGAVPGPACYGRGGTAPTVTDANVVLGLLRPEHFLGGEMALHPALAEQAVDTLGLPGDARDAARQVVQIVDANMTQAIRLVSTERGIDPSGFTLVPYGGAGPLHACRLAEALGIRRVFVPPFPGLVSAWGLLVADLVIDVTQTDILTTSDAAALETRFVALDERLRAAIANQGLPDDNWSSEATLDMRYRGQAYELPVPIARTVADAEGLLTHFHELHQARYGTSRPGDAVQAVTFRLRASRPVQPLTPPAPPVAGEPVAQYADATLPDGTQRIPFYDRPTLPAAFTTNGPCVIEEPTATTFIPAGWKMQVTPDGGWMCCVTLEHSGLGTNELLFRPVERADMATLERWLNDFGTLRTAGIGIFPHAVTQLEQWYARLSGSEAGEHWFIIVERASGSAIGFAGLRDVNERQGSAEYAITIGEPAARGRGYGTSATRCLLAYAFRDLGLRSVLLDVSAYNLAGQRAYARAGFREIGQRHESDLLGGRWWDTIFMEATCETWEVGDGEEQR